MQQLLLSGKRMILRFGLWVFLSFFCVTAFSQDLPPAYAITNVTIHQAGQVPMTSGTIVWRDGIVMEIGKDANIPFDAFTIDGGDSLHVYPGLIDALTTWGSPDETWNGEPKTDPGNPTYVRAGIRPERKPSDLLNKTSKDFENALKAGFTTANLVPKGRMLPGSTELVLLNKEVNGSMVYTSGGRLFQFESSGGSWDDRAYPSTDMAVIANFRQLLYNASALQEQMRFAQTRTPSSLPVVERDPVLMALFPVLNGDEPLYFYVSDSEDLDRFFTLQDEFGFRAIIVTGENVAEWAVELRRRAIPVLSTFQIPKKPDWMKEEEDLTKKSQQDSTDQVSTVEQAEDTRPDWKIEEERLFRARQKQAWLTHVKSIAALKAAGIQVGYAGLGTSLKDLNTNISALLEYGDLSSEDLLRMMTLSNAEILGVEDRLGAIQQGSIASFSIFSEEFTAPKATVLMTITNGHVLDWKE